VYFLCDPPDVLGQLLGPLGSVAVHFVHLATNVVELCCQSAELTLAEFTEEPLNALKALMDLVEELAGRALLVNMILRSAGQQFPHSVRDWLTSCLQEVVIGVHPGSSFVCRVAAPARGNGSGVDREGSLY
jgi:hypothetical protein